MELQVELVFEELAIVAAHGGEMETVAIVKDLEAGVIDVKTGRRVEPCGVLDFKEGLVKGLGPLEGR